MKISITIKLFLALLAVCSAVALMQAAAMRISIERGFFGYLNEQGQQSMDELLPRLSASYREHDGWDYLHGHLNRWIETIRPKLPLDFGDLQPTIADQTGAIIRMGLLDENLVRIAGNPQVNANSIRHPIVIDGRTVGWIAMISFEEVLAPGEAQFLSLQLRMLWIITAISVLVIAFVTFLVTKTLLRRVRRLAQATHALAAGNYAQHIEPGPRDELGSLAQDFNRMAQSLEHHEQARHAFMADISHELRTPMAVIRAELEAIQDGVRSATAESLDVMHQEVAHMGKLIGDLHDLSLTTVGGQAYRRMPIDLTLLLQTVTTSMRRRFEGAGLHLKTDIPEESMLVVGDETRLQQLFANLLENSLRYTATGGEVWVRCLLQHASVGIQIEDSAPGVPPDKLGHLFERFYRVEASRNRASGGSGLGLAICRNIVNAHHGQIKAMASQLGGLVIFIEIPLAT